MSFGEGKAIWLALHRSIFPPCLHHMGCATSLQLFAPLCHNWEYAVELKSEPNIENNIKGLPGHFPFSSDNFSVCFRSILSYLTMDFQRTASSMKMNPSIGVPFSGGFIFKVKYCL